MILIEAGETLRNTREKSGVSLDEASNDLNIPVIILEQIEDGSIGSFEDIYDLKQKMVNYAKYLGLNTETVINKFNEYMFDYTSKIPMDEIEKQVREKNKEKEDEDRIFSPYTRMYPKEKTLPYILTGVLVIILVIIAIVWSVKQITVDNSSTDVIGVLNWLGGSYEFTK